MESRLLKEAALREVEKRRLRELEEVKRELQRLLEEERQAKRDEEIVRQLQARYCNHPPQKSQEMRVLAEKGRYAFLTVIYLYYNNNHETCPCLRSTGRCEIFIFIYVY